MWAIAEFTLRFCARLDFGSLPSNAVLSLANIPIVSDAAGGNAPLEADIPQRPSTQQPLPQNSADTAQGVSIGDGLLTVPKKLAERIWRWEFVELGDLLPENWVGKTEDTNPLGVVRRKRQITDIHTWIQCFASFVSVQSLKYPEAVPDLLAYMTSIMRASREYSGLAWAQYDTAYRRQAASTNNRRWAQINPSLYSICFTGRAQGSTPRCELCTSVFHTAKDCPFSTKTEMEKTLEAVLTACTGRSGGPSGGTESTEICRKWNNLQCSYQWCRYRHVCLACGGAHPLRQCQSDPGRARAAPPSQFGTPPSKKLRNGP